MVGEEDSEFCSQDFGGKIQQKKMICTKEGQNWQVDSVRRCRAFWKRSIVLFLGFSTKYKHGCNETTKLDYCMGRKIY